MMQAAETILPPISTPTATRVTVAPGDGIGPEITAAVLRVLDAAGANLSVEPIAIGMQAAERGAASGIHPDAWSSVRRTRVLL
jgi:isocitrate dehydrogenase